MKTHFVTRKALQIYVFGSKKVGAKKKKFVRDAVLFGNQAA